MQPAEPKLELVLSVRPRDIVARLIAKEGVLPWVITGTPGDVVWRLQLNLWHAAADVVGEREEAGGRPPGWLRRNADRVKVDGVAAEEERGLVQQRWRVGLRELQ